MCDSFPLKKKQTNDTRVWKKSTKFWYSPDKENSEVENVLLQMQSWDRVKQE